MPNTAVHMLNTLQKLIQRCLASGGEELSCPGQHSFHAWCCAAPQPHQAPSQSQQACHTAFELEEVLLQVFRHLDSRTLCTTMPLVCQHWRAAAACDQLWAPRCDPLLLSAVQPQPLADTASSAEAAPAGPRPCCYTVALPRLHHAVYTFNLLRNPLFLAAANAGYSSSLPRTRSGSSGSSSSWDGSGSARPQAVLTPEQRKLAWVTTVGTPSWEGPTTGAAAGSLQLQPPLPLKYPATPTTSSSNSRLQALLFGRTAANSSATAPAASATAGSSSGGCSSALGQVCQARQAGGQGLSYLATGSSWAEVVQVVDLLGELTARGLPSSTAAAILDRGVLAICLSFWVAAAPGSTTTSSTTSSTSATAGEPSGLHSPGPSPAQFAAALMLDGGQVPLRSFQTFVRNDSSHHFFSKRLAVDPADGWRRYVYVVPSCPKGLRRAVVLLRGRGTGPGSTAAAAEAAAAGSSGSSGGVKFACAQLSFVRRDELEGLGAPECLEGWQDRVVHGF